MVKIPRLELNHSKDMKKDPELKNRGDLEWLGSVKVIGNVTIQENA